MRISANSGLYSPRPYGRPRFTLLEALDFFHETGFEAVDINLCATIYGVGQCNKVRDFTLDGDWQANAHAVRERAEQLGMPIDTAHLPFINQHPTYELDIDYIISMTYRCLEAMEIFGTKWTVAHYLHDVPSSLEYLRPLCEFATKRNIGLAIENTPWTPIDYLYEIVDTLKGEGYKVGICFDVGHANLVNYNMRDTLHDIGDRLRVLHLHDNWGVKDNHQIPFAGNINWNDVMLGLADIGFEGDFNYEVNSRNVPEECRRAQAEYLVSVARSLIKVYEARREEIKNEK